HPDRHPFLFCFVEIKNPAQRLGEFEIAVLAGLERSRVRFVRVEARDEFRGHELALDETFFLPGAIQNRGEKIRQCRHGRGLRVAVGAQRQIRKFGLSRQWSAIHKVERTRLTNYPRASWGAEEAAKFVPGRFRLVALPYALPELLAAFELRWREVLFKA